MTTKYVLVMKDYTGRGIKSLLSFKNAKDRDEHVIKAIKYDGATMEEINYFIDKLELGGEEEFENTGYEYFNVVEN